MKRQIVQPNSLHTNQQEGLWEWLKTKSVKEMPRKCIVKVVLSKEQKEILSELARRLGTSESETLRMALMDYAKELSLIRERVHRLGKQLF
jgi:hypothetical protein